MRRDLEKYLITVQKQRDEMLKALDEANSLILEGKIQPEQVDSIQNYFNILESNYQRILYCRYLYNLPPKFIQKLMKKKLRKEMEEFVKNNADEETVVKENQECLEKVGEVTHE